MASTALADEQQSDADAHRAAVLASSGRYAAMRDDVLAAGIWLAPHDLEEPLRLAELRAVSGLKFPSDRLGVVGRPGARAIIRA